MTRGQCQNDGTCVPDELSPLIRRQQRRKGTEALWDKSRVKDGANADRLLVHTSAEKHIHTPALVSVCSHTHTHTHTHRCTANQLSDSPLVLRFLPFTSSYNVATEVSGEMQRGSVCYSLLYYLNATCRVGNTSHRAPPFRQACL